MFACTRMNSSCYFKRGARTFLVTLIILLGIRLASVFACIGELNSFNPCSLTYRGCDKVFVRA